MKSLSEAIIGWPTSVRQQFNEASGFRARLQIVLSAALVVVELVAVFWVLTSYRFESVIPVYQQF